MFRRLPVMLILALVSCTPHTYRLAHAPSTLPEFPLEKYLSADKGSVYEITGSDSYANVLVQRGGKLARFGHDHVVSARNIYGYVKVTDHSLEGSCSDMRIDLVTLVVDDPLTRKEFDLDTEPSQEDIQNTTENMQSKVLESDKWPQTHLEITVTGGTLDKMEADLTIALHGQALALPIVIHIDEFTPDHLLASGSFSLLQSVFGIKPFSVLGGALYVEDTLAIDYRLAAQRVFPAAESEN